MVSCDYIVLNAKKGISTKQIQRDLNISYPTAWRMLHQIRKAMSCNIDKHLFTGILEMDETYIGGKPRKNKDSEIKTKKGKGQKRLLSSELSTEIIRKFMPK